MIFEKVNISVLDTNIPQNRSQHHFFPQFDFLRCFSSILNKNMNLIDEVTEISQDLEKKKLRSKYTLTGVQLIDKSGPFNTRVVLGHVDSHPDTKLGHQDIKWTLIGYTEEKNTKIPFSGPFNKIILFQEVFSGIGQEMNELSTKM